jgi:hypothetical protein
MTKYRLNPRRPRQGRATRDQVPRQLPPLQVTVEEDVIRSPSVGETLWHLHLAVLEAGRRTTGPRSVDIETNISLKR